MLDHEGNLVTSAKGVEKLAVEHYTKVLENRPMLEKYLNLKTEKDKLCDEHIKIAKQIKTKPWTMDELEAVLKHLKKNKSRDPKGYANEVFRTEVAGDDLKLALLKLMNRVKDEQIIPKEFELCSITSIFKKGKAGKNDFNNYRGVFRVNIFRSILDRLIFNDYFGKVDDFLTDCNVGGRPKRNIRDYLFVLNAITNLASKGKGKPCDIAAYDIEKCFDAMWAQETINDMWDAGCRDNKLSILHMENQSAQVVVKTAAGKSDPVVISNFIMQGGVMGGLFCTNSMDKLGKIVYEDENLLYTYKGTKVPCLQMVDDIITVTECESANAVKMNSVVNTFVETKKMKLSEKSVLLSMLENSVINVQN